MSNHAHENDADGLFLFAVPGLDRKEVLQRVRANVAKRVPLSHPAAAIGQARMRQERQALLRSLAELQRSMRHCGLVASHRRGWLGRLDRLIKRGLRKLFFRHLLQQHRVHLKLAKFLSRLIEHLEAQDQSFRLCLDLCERQYGEIVPPLAAEPETTLRHERISKRQTKSVVDTVARQRQSR
jgi:hypothetical protein